MSGKKIATLSYTILITIIYLPSLSFGQEIQFEGDAADISKFTSWIADMEADLPNYYMGFLLKEARDLGTPVTFRIERNGTTFIGTKAFEMNFLTAGQPPQFLGSTSMSLHEKTTLPLRLKRNYMVIYIDQIEKFPDLSLTSPGNWTASGTYPWATTKQHIITHEIREFIEDIKKGTTQTDPKYAINFRNETHPKGVAEENRLRALLGQQVRRTAESAVTCPSGNQGVEIELGVNSERYCLDGNGQITITYNP